MSEKLYSISEVAKMTKLSRVHIWWMVKSRIVKAQRIGIKIWAIPESEIPKIKKGVWER